MLWTSDDAERHERKATTRALKELWAKVANECLERTGESGIGASLPFPLPPAEVGFSIAADVKFQSMTSCCHPALWLMTPHELALLFEVGVRPPHDGMRRMGRNNLTGILATDRCRCQQSAAGSADLRTPPTRRPREDMFLPKQNPLSPCC